MKKESMTDEEKELLRERNRFNKQRSQLNMSKQKRYSVKLKDRNRKRKIQDDESQKSLLTESSTPRAQAFRRGQRENLLVKLPFKVSKLNRSEKRKSKEASKSLLALGSPSKKAQFVNLISKSAKSSPRTKLLLEKENSLSTSRILERLKGRKDNSANIVRIITTAVVNETPQQSLREQSKDMGVSIKTLRKSIKDLQNMGTLSL